MDRAVKQWLEHLNLSSQVILTLPYNVYGSMLLLPGTAFEGPKWLSIKNRCSSDDFDVLHHLIAKHLKITHIAINRPIPLLEGDHVKENIIRAPTNFTPVFGDFGPETCSSPPIAHDFAAAYWTTAKQNGIYQTWAPRWTMFSRGNISEKARLATLPSVKAAVEQGEVDGKGCAVVDLYVGIGYFAFSYLKAGFEQVICWDLNPWSIEGLRRGAESNRWKSIVLSDRPDVDRSAFSDASLLVFNETNENAMAQIQTLRHRCPPIRHVNCGLLPTSRGSWQTALDALDPTLGGWIHVHENFAVKEIEDRVCGVRDIFQEMSRSRGGQRIVEVEGVHQVKSYAPGVMHCVIDLHIPAPAAILC